MEKNEDYHDPVFNYTDVEVKIEIEEGFGIAIDGAAEVKLEEEEENQASNCFEDEENNAEGNEVYEEEKEIPILPLIPPNTVTSITTASTSTPSDLKEQGRNRKSNIAKIIRASDSSSGAGIVTQHIDAYTCEICRKSFKHTGSLFNHRMRHQEPQLPCPVCQKCFYMQYEVRRHLAHAHGPKQKPDPLS